MICSSLNLDRFIVYLPYRDRLYTNLEEFQGLRSEIIWEGKAATEPGELVRTLHLRAPAAMKVGLETGPLSTWLWHALQEAKVPVVCLDARHAQAALSMRINKTDRNDAAGLAQLVRMGWYREVKVKRLRRMWMVRCWRAARSWCSSAASWRTRSAVC
jgi:transposase